MAKYKFYYSTMDNPNMVEEFESSINIKSVDTEFKNVKGNIIKIRQIDILEDPDQINTDEALGYVR